VQGDLGHADRGVERRAEHRLVCTRDRVLGSRLRDEGGENSIDATVRSERSFERRYQRVV
jgi:hypothetical protein